MPRLGHGLWPRQHRGSGGGGPPVEEYSPPLTAAGYNGDTLSLLAGYVPSSRTASTWDDVSGNARHLTFTGSPAQDNSGPMEAMAFDGSNDRADWNGTGFADTDLTIIAVVKPAAWPSAGAYAGLLELSDTAGSDRSHWMYLYGSSNSIGARTGASDGAISFTGGATSWQVVRMSVTADARSVWINGVYKGSSGMTKTGRTVTRLRLGNRIAGDVSYFNGSIAAVLIYSGRLSDAACIDIEDELFTLLSITAPWDYADIPASTDETGSPRFSLPIGEVPVITGIPLRLERLSTVYYDGRASLDSETLPATGTDLTSHARIIPAAGSNEWLAEKNGEAWLVDFYGRSPPASGKRYVLAFGNSNIHRMQSGLFEFIHRRLGSSLVEFVGTVAAPSGFHTPAEGRDSWVLSSTALALGASGAFNASGSPFFAGGASLNLASYSASLTHAPTHVIMACFQNAVYLSSEGALETNLTAENAAATAILHAMADQWTGVKVGLMMEWPLLANPNGGWGSWSQSDLYRRKMHRAMEYLQNLAGGLDGYHGMSCSLISTYPHVNVGERAYNAWEDNIHMSAWGHQDLLSTTLGWLAANW